MKLIVFSDIHIDNYKRFDKQGSRLKNCIAALECILKKAGELCPVLFCGDMFNHNGVLHAKIIEEVIKTITSQNARIYAISGNHDQFSRQTLENTAGSSLDFVTRLNNSRGNAAMQLLNGEEIVIDNLYLYGIPYFRDSKEFHAKLKELSDKASRVASNTLRILMTHQTPIGSVGEHIPTDTDPFDPLYESFDFVFNGHIHKRQQLSDKYYVIGNPLHQDLSDAGQKKGYYILDTETRTMEFVPLDFPEFVVGKEAEGSKNYFVPRESEIELQNIEVEAVSKEGVVAEYWENVDGKDRELLQEGINLLQ